MCGERGVRECVVREGGVDMLGVCMYLLGRCVCVCVYTPRFRCCSCLSPWLALPPRPHPPLHDHRDGDGKRGGRGGRAKIRGRIKVRGMVKEGG